MKMDNLVKGLLLLIVILLFVSILTQQNWVIAEEENTNYQLQWSQSVAFSIIETNTGRVWIYSIGIKKPLSIIEKPGEELKIFNVSDDLSPEKEPESTVDPFSFLD